MSALIHLPPSFIKKKKRKVECRNLSTSRLFSVKFRNLRSRDVLAGHELSQPEITRRLDRKKAIVIPNFTSLVKILKLNLISWQHNTVISARNFSSVVATVSNKLLSFTILVYRLFKFKVLSLIKNLNFAYLLHTARLNKGCLGRVSPYTPPPPTFSLKTFAFE